MRLVFFLRRIRNWKDYVVIVKASTVRDWIREMNREIWSLKCWIGKARKRIRRALGLEKRPGRRPTGKEIIDAIHQILKENPNLGVDRIRGELLNLGLKVGRTTVVKYMNLLFPDRPYGRKRKKDDLTWKQFACALKEGVCAMDFFTCFDFLSRQLFCFHIINHRRRELLHLSATYHPTQAWVIQQLKNTFADLPNPKYLISDNDQIFIHGVSDFIKGEGIDHSRTARASPWQNPVAERVIRTIREDLTDRVILTGSKHACDLLEEYREYYNKYRPHLTLESDSPEGRPITPKPSANAKLESVSSCCGLVRYYRWREVG